MNTMPLPILFLHAVIKTGSRCSVPPLKRIGTFKLKNEFVKNGSINKFSTGIYIDERTGKKAFGKTLVEYSRYNVSSFTNEAVMYDLLLRLQKSVNHRIPRAIKHVRIPNSFGMRNNKGVMSLLVEFIEGIPLTEHTPAYQIEVYEKTVNYIRFLGDNLSREQKEKIGKRLPLVEVMIYPFLVFFSIAAYWRKTPLILKGIIPFYKNAFSYLKDQRQVLTHRDLHLKNILVHKDDAFLVDLENMVFTHPDYEYVVSFLACFRKKELAEKMWWLVNNKRIGKLLLIKMTTHYLTHGNLSKNKYEDYIEALDWAIKI